jgi:cyclic pyranopterin phosphate synthase
MEWLLMHPRVYPFEGIDDDLDLVPLAARRALDAATIKISLEAWRESSLALRRAIAALGAAPVVDPAAVRAAVAEAGMPTSAVAASPEPTPGIVPAELGASVTLSVWGALTPLDRYALWKVARGKHPEDVLPRACAEIAPLSTHVGARGEAHMVDVGAKAVTSRRAVARARVSMEVATAARLRAGDVAKGDVLATARIAGIQAAKRTSELIPLCHVIALTRVTIELTVDPIADPGLNQADPGVTIEAVAEAVDRTGVEMEALTAASIAALTVYDMLKSVDRGMRITVELAEKSGGKTGVWRRA